MFNHNDLITDFCIHSLTHFYYFHIECLICTTIQNIHVPSREAQDISQHRSPKPRVSNYCMRVWVYFDL